MWSIRSGKKCHNAIPIIIFTFPQVVNISNIFCDYCQVFYPFICLNSEPARIEAKESIQCVVGKDRTQKLNSQRYTTFLRIKNNHEGWTFSSFHHTLAQIQGVCIFFGQNLNHKQIGTSLNCQSFVVTTHKCYSLLS